MKAEGADGFTTGYKPNEIDNLYIFDMDDVCRAGAYGTAGQYGLGVKDKTGNIAGNRWPTNVVKLAVSNDHIWFLKDEDNPADGIPECHHYCAVCGEHAIDPDTGEEIVEPTVDVPAVPAKPGKAGSTAGQKYRDCGTWITEPQVIPALPKLAQPMTVKAKKKVLTLKAKTLKKKVQNLAVSKTMKIANAQGDKSFKITKVLRGKSKKFKKHFKINAKNGKLTVKKKLKKGTYKVTVQVTAAGNDTYNAGAKNVTLKIKVK